MFTSEDLHHRKMSLEIKITNLKRWQQANGELQRKIQDEINRLSAECRKINQRI